MPLHLRRYVVALAVSASLWGCTEKKAAPPPEPPKPVEAPKPPPPVMEAQADPECAAPIEPGPATELKVGDRTASRAGYKLTFSDADKDGTLTLGLLGPINEDSGQNMLVLKKFQKFFADEKVDAIIVTGDVGEVADGIARVLKQLGESKVPVLAIAGNRECRAEYTDGVNAAMKASSWVVNMNAMREVQFPELTIVSLPGYHDPNFITCATGCRYVKSTVDAVVSMAKDSKVPVLLVSHGNPKGNGNQAIDFASAGGNVGNDDINRAITEANIAFGVSSNVKEAGGRATVDAAGTALVKENTASKTLFINPGPADTVGWEMNDGNKSTGMAAVMHVKDGQASYKMYRVKALSAAEKAEAKKMDPPNRAEKKEDTAASPAPTPEKK